MSTNKMMGFFELQDSGLPTVAWHRHQIGDVLNPALLWTVRSAVVSGPDHSLPRLVGAPAAEAMTFADVQAKKLGANGMVVTYPYFKALVSGNLEVTAHTVYLEAVKGDLWRLVDEGALDATARNTDDTWTWSDQNHLCPEPLRAALQQAVRRARHAWHSEIITDSVVLLEWSWAQNLGPEEIPSGEPHLLFYEARVQESHFARLP